MTREQIYDRYVALANQIAVLVEEANELEEAMEEGKHFPMSLQVGDRLRSAHGAVLHPCLTTLMPESQPNRPQN